MILTRASTLPVPAASAWEAALRVDTFRYVTAPLLRFPAADLVDACWVVGLELEDQLLLLGFIPLGRHHIRIESIDEEARRSQTRERGGLVRRWDHHISVEPIGEHSCRYTDRLEIEAGAFTLLVGLFARLLFRYRHRRWQRLARQLAA